MSCIILRSCTVVGYMSYYTFISYSNFAPFAHLCAPSSVTLTHMVFFGVFSLCAVELRGVPVERVRERRTRNSFIHLKIKHLTGSSACVSAPCGLTLTHRRSHMPFEMGFCNRATELRTQTHKILLHHNIEFGPVNIHTSIHRAFLSHTAVH